MSGVDQTDKLIYLHFGARFSSLRSSLQGKQEERLPFFGFSFPEWFKSKYSEAFQNFR
jgi:hypothetical protein